MDTDLRLKRDCQKMTRADLFNVRKEDEEYFSSRELPLTKKGLNSILLSLGKSLEKLEEFLCDDEVYKKIQEIALFEKNEIAFIQNAINRCRLDRPELNQCFEFSLQEFMFEDASFEDREKCLDYLEEIIKKESVYYQAFLENIDSLIEKSKSMVDARIHDLERFAEDLENESFLQEEDEEEGISLGEAVLAERRGELQIIIAKLKKYCASEWVV